MIEIGVSHFRGCRSASVALDPIALVAGLNGAGKSSLAQGAAAALCGDTMPVAGLGRHGERSLVSSTSPTGEAAVHVTSEKGLAGAQWPAGTTSRTGTAPAASEWAVGLRSIATLPPRDRAVVLADYLHAAPTKNDLGVAMIEAGFTDDAVDAVWLLVEQHEWDGAEAQRRQRGQELKGAWRQVTGQVWGAKVGGSWRPDLAEGDVTESGLHAAVNGARRDYENAVAAAAVSAGEADRLRTVVADKERRRDALVEAEGKVAELVTAYGTAQAARQALPPSPLSSISTPCPHCGEPVRIEKINDAEMRLEKATVAEPDHDATKRRRLALAEADGKLAKANDDLMLARATLTRAQLAVSEVADAETALANWPRATPQGGDVDAAKAALARAEHRLADWQKKVEADTIHRRIEGNETIVGLLAGDGLRKAKLALVLEAFNGTRLRALCEAAGWARVDVDVEMAIRYGGRGYALLSTSEQYRVRVVLAVAMAQLDQSDVVVFDGADVLDAAARGGLLDMLEVAGIPAALVCLTLARRDQVPDLAAAGLGRSYWIEAGTAEPLMRQRAA